jgi:WD40 repeat protein
VNDRSAQSRAPTRTRPPLPVHPRATDQDSAFAGGDGARSGHPTNSPSSRVRATGRGALVLLALFIAACGSTAKNAAVPTTTTQGGTPSAELWVARYNGPANGAESIFPTATQTMAISPDGAKVFVVGTSQGTTSGNDYVTVAYATATGRQLWEARYTGPGDQDDVVGAVTVSPDGKQVFVTGGSTGTDTGLDTATVAYNVSTGAQLWVARYDGPAHKNEGGGSIAVDPSGAKVFVTGTSEGTGEMEKTYATLAYDATSGTQLWVERYNAPTNRASAGSLALSPDGTMVYVTGWSETASGGKDYATVTYHASTGSQAWVATYQGSGGDNEGRSVAVSADGSKLFVIGSGSAATGLGYATVGYNASTGAQMWAETYTSPPQTGSTYTSTIRVSPDGSKVFVAGIGGTAAYGASNGKQLWVHPGGATALAVSRDGATLFVTGAAETGTARTDYATAAYDTATGNKLWTASYNGPANGDDGANSIAVSPTGNTVFVTGTSEGAGTGADLATVVYRG